MTNTMICNKMFNYVCKDLTQNLIIMDCYLALLLFFSLGELYSYVTMFSDCSQGLKTDNVFLMCIVKQQWSEFCTAIH